MKGKNQHPLFQIANDQDSRFKAALFLELNGFIPPALACQIVGLSGSEIHRLRKAGRFPEPETISGTRKGYRAHAIQQWLEHRENWNKNNNQERQSS